MTKNLFMVAELSGIGLCITSMGRTDVPVIKVVKTGSLRELKDTFLSACTMGSVKKELYTKGYCAL